MQNPQVTPVVPVDTAIQFWVKNNQCQSAQPAFFFPDIFPTDNSTAELYAFQQCHCNSDVLFYKLINGGHTWPGVYVASQASILGNTNRDINASQELWQFFNQHTLCSTPLATENQATNNPRKLYPNPTRSILHVATPMAHNAQMRVFNAVGQTMYDGPWMSTLDVALWPAGIYTLVLYGQGPTEAQRWIKQ
jgi:polyhydroxybutyrate depolymerase